MSSTRPSGPAPRSEASATPASSLFCSFPAIARRLRPARGTAWLGAVAGALSIALTLFASAVARADDPARPVVSTFSGSGRAGALAGPAADAQFIAPYGIAVAKNGDLYVTDYAAHVVRRVSPSGAVEPFAGEFHPRANPLYADGGDLNGPVASARFDGPAGIVVRPDGSVLVADSRNACIKRIAAGSVTTFAGTCGVAGKADGPAASASFEEPLGLALAADGTLFVADRSAGLRVISPAGSVSTIAGSESDATGVCLAPDAGTEALAVLGRSGIELRDPRSPARPGRSFPADAPQDIQGIRSIGEPYACTFLNDRDLLYSDVRSSAVRLFHITAADETAAERTIAGAEAGDDPNEGGGFRDGSGVDARFATPFGLAHAGAATYVADGGNHRIRALSPFDLGANDDPPSSAQPGELRIAYVGTSVTWWNSSRAESTGVVLQNYLAKSLGRAVRVDTYTLVGAGPAALESALREEIVPLGYDAVVFTMNSYAVDEISSTSHLVTTATTWQPAFEAKIASLRDAARDGHLNAYIVDQPFGWELSVTESFGEDLPGELDDDYGARYRLFDQSVGRIFPEHLSLASAIERSDAAGTNPPVFGTDDGHPTAFGRALFAKTIGQYLISRGVGTAK